LASVSTDGLKVVRLTAKSREDVESSVGFLSLHEQVRMNDSNLELMKLSQLKRRTWRVIQSRMRRNLKVLTRAASARFSPNGGADVIAVLVLVLAIPFGQMKFRTVLIDESTQSAEPEWHDSISSGMQAVVLVGDHQQLGPVIMNKKAAKAGLNQSLFERLVISGLALFDSTFNTACILVSRNSRQNMFYEALFRMV